MKIAFILMASAVFAQEQGPVYSHIAKKSTPVPSYNQEPNFTLLRKNATMGELGYMANQTRGALLDLSYEVDFNRSQIDGISYEIDQKLQALRIELKNLQKQVIDEVMVTVDLAMGEGKLKERTDELAKQEEQLESREDLLAEEIKKLQEKQEEQLIEYQGLIKELKAELEDLKSKLDIGSDGDFSNTDNCLSKSIASVEVKHGSS